MTRVDRADERGAMLIHIAVAMLGLLAFSALVIDYGVMWASRRQAQNAADAAALAAATSLAYDAPTDFDRARAAAKTIGETNRVFGGTLNITQGSGSGGVITDDISFPTCPPGAPGPPDTCVRVNVYRTDLAQGGFPAKDPLPTFFGRLFGRQTQGVRATATAQFLMANASDCMKPWAVADKWGERIECSDYATNGTCQGTWQPSDTWTPDKTFDKYQGGTLNPAIPDLDTSTPGPDYDYYDETTGYRPFDENGDPTADYGLILQLKQGSGGGPNERYSSGWFQKLDLPCGDNPDCPTNSGADKYRWQIQNCIQVPIAIGDDLTFDNQTGNTTGPTSQATYRATGQQPLSLWERDPTARWNPDTKSIENSCAGTGRPCADGFVYSQSPRIVAIPTFNLDEYLAADPNGSGQTVTVTDILGFFVLSPDEAEDLGKDLGTGNPNDSVWGVLVTVPGTYSSTSNETSSFLRSVILVR
jgi:hypothetical protein